MARKRLSMRKAREILRLRHEARLSIGKIALSCQISASTVLEYLRRAEQAGISWPIPAEMDEDRLQEVLFVGSRSGRKPKYPLLDYSYIHRELKRRGVTRKLLWEEYRKDHEQGYGYTQYCGYYRRWKRSQEVSIRQEYIAGEKMFVDWAGQTIPITDPQTGLERPAHLFVSVLGASNYTYAEAFENKRQAFWIEGHIHSYEYFDGVAKVTVPDNEKTGVNKACRYEPDLNPAYREMAEHYGTVIIPTRPREPRDKAKVENAVLCSERWILARLRNMRFFSVSELNQAIRRLLEELNNRPFQKMPGTRAELYHDIDRPALLPLPETRFEQAEWRKAKVNIDYHVQADNHFYSVPFSFVGGDMDVRLTALIVEIFHKGQRVACHMRSNKRGCYSTIPEHRPKSHQKHLEWTPSRLVHWADNVVGKNCSAAVEKMLKEKPHPEMGYRACLGLMRLKKVYGKDRLEMACERAVILDVCTYRSIKSMLETRMEAQPANNWTCHGYYAAHENIRGQQYYQ